MNIKTVEISGVTPVVIGNRGDMLYITDRYWWIRNKGDSSIYASLSDDVTAGADGTAEIPAGEVGMIEIDRLHSCIYLNGSGGAEIRTASEPVCPFKSGAKGGESGGNALLETITEFPENPTDNKPYLFLDSDIGDILAVHYNGVWNFASLNQYPFKYKINAAELFSIGRLIDTSENMLSLIDRTTEFSDDIFTKSIKLCSLQQDNISITYELLIDFKSATSAKLYYGISSEQADKCTVYLNDAVIEENIGGTSSMTENKREVTFVPTTGLNKLKFVYKKDSSQSMGEDSVFIYAVDFTAGG